MNNLKELFVSKEIAIKLASKGFYESCFGFYTKEGKLIMQFTAKGSLDECEELFIAPMHHQVINWFRINHNTHIEIFHQLRPANNFKYEFKIGSSTENVFDGYDSYEEALEKSLLKAIELLN